MQRTEVECSYCQRRTMAVVGGELEEGNAIPDPVEDGWQMERFDDWERWSCPELRCSNALELEREEKRRVWQGQDMWEPAGTEIPSDLEEQAIDPAGTLVERGERPSEGSKA